MSSPPYTTNDRTRVGGEATFGGARGEVNFDRETQHVNPPPQRVAAEVRHQKVGVGAVTGAVAGVGIGGGIGAVIGAVIGTVVPGPGTVIGAAIGGAAGAAIGGGTGTTAGATGGVIADAIDTRRPHN